MSNLVIIVPCLVGLYNCYAADLELRFYMSFLGLLAVGVGSWLFHMTLLWHYQLVDELSMIYASCIFLYCIVDTRFTTGLRGALLVIALLAYAFFVTYFYLHNKEAVFHQTAYGVQVAAIIALAYVKSRSAPERVRILYPIAITTYLSAFALWNVDNQLCGHLQWVRAYLGIFAPVIELHAWWHIGVGIGSYLYVVFSIATRLQQLQTHVHIDFVAGLPIVRPMARAQAKQQ